ncbi:hypothetical protein ACHAXR_004064 [Thalassiosira sp. AJA248-18]
MPKLKRVSEAQLNKDIYDAGEDDRFAETPDPGQGMTRASRDVIQRRKIVKVSRRKFGGGGSGTVGGVPSAPQTMPVASPKQPAASSNPFASTKLLSSAQPTATTVAGKEPSQSTKSNPFGNIAFASTSSSSAPKPTFSFASSAPSAATQSAPKPATTSTGFSFSSNTAASSSVMTAPKTSLVSTPRSSSSSKGKKEMIRQLNENLLNTIVDHWEGRMFTQNYSHFMKEYQEHESMLNLEDGEGGSDGAIKSTSGSGTSTTLKLTLTSKNNSQPAASSFSFGTGAAAPNPPPAAAAAKPFSMMGASSSPTAAPPTGSFSFTSKPTAPPAAGASSSAPSFSFGAPSSSSTFTGGGAPSSTATTTNGADPTSSNPDDGKVEKVEQEENTEEEILHEVRAKHIKFENKQWKKYGAGVLRLYRHKQTSKHRMVIRNEIGKVQFNVGVSKGMKFEKIIKDSKKGKAAFVKFFAVEDASKGLENFMLQVKPGDLDKLHEILEGMVV